MSRARNSQARSGRQPESLPPRLPEDVYNTRMRDLLELEPSPNDGEWDRGWSTALKRLWHRGFRGEAGYTSKLISNLERCIETRTLDSRSTTFCVEVDVVPERPLSLVLSATMRTPYSKTKVRQQSTNGCRRGKRRKSKRRRRRMGFGWHPARLLGCLRAVRYSFSSFFRKKNESMYYISLTTAQACSHPPVWLDLRLQHPLYGGAFDAPIMLLKLDAPTLQAMDPHPSPSSSKSKLSL